MLFRGHKYVFVLDGTLANFGGSSHPFVVQTDGVNPAYGGIPYNTGFTPNLPLTGLNTVNFVVPVTAPNNLYYRSENTPGMGGNIVIKNFLKDHRVFMTSVIAALSFEGNSIWTVSYTHLRAHET